MTIFGRQSSVSFLVLFAAMSYAAGPAASDAGRVHILKSDFTLRSPRDRWSYYFDLVRGSGLGEGAYLDLDFTVAPTVGDNTGTLSVYLNGTPVDSTRVSRSPRSWHVVLPARFMKRGSNEIRVTREQNRDRDAPCSDTDDSADWLRISDSSILVLPRAKGTAIPLASYPYPFVNRLSDGPTEATFGLPQSADPSAIEAMLTISAFLGASARDAKVSTSVTRTGAPNGTNVVAVLAPDSSGKVPPQSANLALSTSAEGARLVIQPADTTGLQKAISALTQPEYVKQLQVSSAVIGGQVNSPEPSYGAKMGEATFHALGYPTLRLSGLYSRTTTVVAYKPLLAKVGRGSEVHIRFRNSATLNPNRSLLSVSINGRPVGSVRLGPNNANDGHLSVPIPVQELGKNRWVIGLEAYHDLGASDCSKSYDDAAWTVIDGDSSLKLVDGSLPYHPSLLGFPYLVGVQGTLSDPVELWLPTKPSDAQLGLAASVAARFGQSNGSGPQWRATLGGDVVGSVIVGTYDDLAKSESFRNGLPVAPLGGGQFQIAKGLRLLPQSLVGGAVIEAVATTKGVQYVAMGANDRALTKLAGLVSDPHRMEACQQEVCVLTADDALISLDTATGDVVESEATTELDRYTPVMKLLTALIVVVLAAAAVWLGMQFRRRPVKA